MATRTKRVVSVNHNGFALGTDDGTKQRNLYQETEFNLVNGYLEMGYIVENVHITSLPEGRINYLFILSNTI